MKKTILILCGGGPAPGINTVIGTIVKTFSWKGYRVLGLHGGYSGLFGKEVRVEELNFKIADRIVISGGSYLVMSRFKPTDEDLEKRFNLQFFKDNNIVLLVTIGGDDTASTANRISKYLKDNKIDISNIHVPKTIDNDLPLPEGIPTFGYQSAVAQGALLGKTVYEDARTSENWFIVTAMGRSAGHLAFGIGSACHFPMIIIPEMFNHAKITTERIVNLMVSAILKRKLLGINYGAIMVSEGIFEYLSEDDIKNSGIDFTFDAHGHPELGKISKSHILDELLTKKLKALKIDVKTRPVEVGYDVRCIAPKAFDLEYCSILGMGVYELFTKGVSGCMVYRDGNGNIMPLFLQDLQDSRTGKIPPRCVDMDSHEIKFYLKYLMNYIQEEDCTAAKMLVEKPEDYIFASILNY